MFLLASLGALGSPNVGRMDAASAQTASGAVPPTPVASLCWLCSLSKLRNRFVAFTAYRYRGRLQESRMGVELETPTGKRWRLARDDIRVFDVL
ncbi:uncharacterized protein EI97DRAFT_96518 [Westerdykella ornata]|uniref:Uncharacterized protein n=1 Tax=Westerdykella ornata TaxID=318751 RepID=A0A6A6JGC4_WESOR|nr:uncharacterized protein EI97DRAFT_96518 [Westerdykella ornata]KAF2274676.1 hypothetical protein EI97DRAFT_96518 [Westerdykella ornata]